MSGQPRYRRHDPPLPVVTDCLDCGVAVTDEAVHTRFHAILGAHAWAIAVLRTAHLADSLHDLYDVSERIDSRTFESWSATALAETIGRVRTGEL